MLHEEIGRLPDRYRTPVVLCYLEGLTQEEAARRLGWPIGTVGVRLMRARERLRGRLTPARPGTDHDGLLPPSPRGRALAGSLATKTARLAISFSSRRPRRPLPRSHPISPAWHSECSGRWRSRRSPARLSRYFVCGLVTGGAVLAFQPPAGRSKAKATQPPASPKTAARGRRAQIDPVKRRIRKGRRQEPGPDAWQKGARIAGVEYQWDRNVAHQGKASLHLKKTARALFPDRPVVSRSETLWHDSAAEAERIRQGQENDQGDPRRPVRRRRRTS